MNCHVCGKPIESQYRVDYFYPPSISLWSYAWLSSSEQFSSTAAFLCKHNQISVHTFCGRPGGKFLPDINDILTTRAKQCDLKVIQSQLSHALRVYTTIRGEVLAEQNGTCALCGKEVSEDETVLVRKDDTLIYGKENAAVVCVKCCSRDDGAINASMRVYQLHQATDRHTSKH